MKSKNLCCKNKKTVRTGDGSGMESCGQDNLMSIKGKAIYKGFGNQCRIDLIGKGIQEEKRFYGRKNGC